MTGIRIGLARRRRIATVRPVYSTTTGRFLHRFRFNASGQSGNGSATGAEPRFQSWNRIILRTRLRSRSTTYGMQHRPSQLCGLEDDVDFTGRTLFAGGLPPRCWASVPGWPRQRASRMGNRVIIAGLRSSRAGQHHQVGQDDWRNLNIHRRRAAAHEACSSPSSTGDLVQPYQPLFFSRGLR